MNSTKPFWTFDRKAGEELSRHTTARSAQMAAKRFSHLRAGHEIAWGPRKTSNSMLGYWRSDAGGFN